MSESRWFRMNVDWWESEWLYVLSAEAQLAWVKFLGRVKSHGFAGRLKKVNLEVLSRQWMQGEESLRQMLIAAEKAGAVEVSGDTWTVVKWREYQGDDSGAARQQRFRERQKEVTPSNALCNEVTLTETETKTSKKENPPLGGKRKKVTFVAPSNIECAAYAKEIGLPLSEAKTFFDHFTSNGWKVGGKAPMQDWNAAMRTWKSRYEKQPTVSNTPERQRPPRFSEAG